MRFRLTLLVLAVFIVVASATYLLTDGCYFLRCCAVPRQNERIELREYEMFAAPSRTNTVRSIAGWLIWRVRNPAQARFVATDKRLRTRTPNNERRLQEVLVAMGYEFPAGCHAVYRNSSRSWWVSHYPSVLQSIEGRLRLTPTFTMSLDTSRDPAPNKPMQPTPR